MTVIAVIELVIIVYIFRRNKVLKKNYFDLMKGKSGK